MNHDQSITPVLLLVIIVSWGSLLVFIEKRRDTRQAGALAKALNFTFANTLFVGLVGVMMAFACNNLTIPLWYSIS